MQYETLRAIELQVEKENQVSQHVKRNFTFKYKSKCKVKVI